MGTITYLLQVSACTAIFYAFYYLLLRRLTFFTINRWYLMASLVLSFVIPLITIPVRQQYVPAMRQVVYTEVQPAQQEIKLTQETAPIVVRQTAKQQIAVSHATKPEPVSINWPELFKVIYLLSASILLVRLLVIIGRFFWQIKGKHSTSLGNIRVIQSDKSFGNGSFLNYIFFNDESLSTTEIQQIIAHELLHVKLYHSVDRLIFKLAQAVLWFNPFIYLYARSVEENHEFEVDREMGRSSDKTLYADLLLHLSVAGQGTLYHSFSKVPLKRRITMLFTKPSNHMKKIIYLLALPVLMISCLAFARFKVTKVANPILKSIDDKPRYKQKVKRTAAELAEQAKQKAINEAWMQTEDYATKKKLIADISGKMLDVIVKEIVPNKENADVIEGFNISYNNSIYFLSTKYGQQKQLNDILKVGDEVKLKTFGISWSIDQPLIIISAASVYKDDKKIFQLAEAESSRSYPYLYEVNKVRFTDGQITNIQKYPNGGWKQAQVQTVNGYKFDISFKPGKTDFSSIAEGDHVTLRFVHEVKGADKTYNINDWVAISNKVGDYGIKNPDFFFKFYELVPEKGAASIDTGKKTAAIDRKIEWTYAEAVSTFWTEKPFKKFFTKVPVTQTDGIPYYRAMFAMANGSASVNLNANEKLGVILDNKFYTEDDIKKYAEGKVLMLGVKTTKDQIVRYNNIDYFVPLTFFAMKLKVVGEQADTVKIGDNIVLKKNKSGVITPKENKMITDKALEEGGPFYERFTIHPNDNRRYDAVVLKLSNGRSVTATLKSGDKFGAIIDGKLHDEERLKKLPEKTIASLSFDDLVTPEIPAGFTVLYTFKTTKN